MPEVYVVAKLQAIAKDVEFYEAADDSCRFALFEFFAGAFADDLHIDARIVEDNILIAFQVCSRVLLDELLFADDFYFPYVADDVAVFAAYHDVAVEERLDGFEFLVLLFGVCFCFAAGGK